MGRRNDHSREQIREMALDAALALLEKAGPSGLSARKVASDIGYTVGTLYLVFENFDDLVVQMNLRTLKKMRLQILAASRAASSPIERLKAIAAAYIAFARAHEHPWRMIYEHPLPAPSDQYQTAVLEEYKAVSRSMFAPIENALAQTVDQAGAWQPQPATSMVGRTISLHARALWGGVHGICILSLANKLDLGDSGALGIMTNLLVERFVSGHEGAA